MSRDNLYPQEWYDWRRIYAERYMTQDDDTVTVPRKELQELKREIAYLKARYEEAVNELAVLRNNFKDN